MFQDLAVYALNVTRNLALDVFASNGKQKTPEGFQKEKNIQKEEVIPEDDIQEA
ncbi:199_t:CDS:2 [Cetraspora pellucida]|uniref:199_t:CDS:1 n=1 Tax=Cetraspora pellucida TaxID=1433469 RepID=A0A9N8VG63_9GLOM|nr:199_t:CDS:2 [Cetraspora pellucida]